MSSPFRTSFFHFMETSLRQHDLFVYLTTASLMNQFPSWLIRKEPGIYDKPEYLYHVSRSRFEAIFTDA